MIIECYIRYIMHIDYIIIDYLNIIICIYLIAEEYCFTYNYKS